MKKRLFITTGSISLINALCIMEQQQSKDEFDDELIVVSFSLSSKFMDVTKKIASLHSFSKIKFYQHEKFVLKNIDFNDYDEVYSVLFSKFYKKLNFHRCVYLFEEGPGSLRANLSELKKAKGIFYSPYLNKFSYINAQKNIPQIEIDKNIFLQISSKVIQHFGENEQLETQKNVLFIGHYIYRKLGDEVALNFYKHNIDYFIEKGYNVYFKGHPRDNDVILPKLKTIYKENTHLYYMKNSLPIEIYNYNFDLVIGAYSGTLISLPYYRDIPSINLPLRELYHSSVGLGFKTFFALYDEYCPSLNKMQSAVGLSLPEIRNLYWSLINKKPYLADNKPLHKIIYYKPNLYKDIFYGAIGILCNKKIKRKLKDFGRKDFYEMIDNFFAEEFKNV